MKEQKKYDIQLAKQNKKRKQTTIPWIDSLYFL